MICKEMKSSFRRTLSMMAILLVCSFAVTPVSAETPKIGFVDLQRALNEVADGKSAKARLKRDFADKQKALDEKQVQVKKFKEDLEAQVMMLKEDARMQKGQELQRQMLELQNLYVGLQKELSAKEAKETKKIFAKMHKLIEKIAADGGYTMILEKTESSIIYALPSMDLTAELIKRYDAK